MKISEVEIGNPYIHIHAYGQPDNNVICIYKTEKSVTLEYESGRTTEFNEIECERYLDERL